jgi:hypothetical protein
MNLLVSNVAHRHRDKRDKTMTRKNTRKNVASTALVISNVETIADSSVEILDADSQHETRDETQAQIDALRDSLNFNVAARVDYETRKCAHECAAKFAKYFSFNFKSAQCELADTFFVAALASQVTSFAMLNDHKRESQAFNVYAAEKLAKAIKAATSIAFRLDEYTSVILRNLDAMREQLEARSIVYTRSTLHYMMTHTLSENVTRSHVKHFKSARCATNTATTQVSSSLRVLEALNVVRVERDTIVRINYDHALFRHVR